MEYGWCQNKDLCGRNNLLILQMTLVSFREFNKRCENILQLSTSCWYITQIYNSSHEIHLRWVMYFIARICFAYWTLIKCIYYVWIWNAESSQGMKKPGKEEAVHKRLWSREHFIFTCVCVEGVVFRLCQSASTNLSLVYIQTMYRENQRQKCYLMFIGT